MTCQITLIPGICDGFIGIICGVFLYYLCAYAYLHESETKPMIQFLNDMKEHFEQNSTLERDDWNRLHGRILAFNPESDFAKFRL